MIVLSSCINPSDPCYTSILHEGDLSLRSQADIDALSARPRITTIKGNLRITDRDSTDPITDTILTGLICLTTVEGLVTIDSTNNIKTLNLGQLQHVGGSFVISSNSALLGAFLPSLKSVGEDLFIFANNIGGMNLESLSSVGAGVNIQGHPDLTKIILPSLSSVGGNIFVSNNRNLESVIIDELLQVSRIQFDQNPSLNGISMQRLIQATDGILIFENMVLRDVSFPNLKIVETRPLVIRAPDLNELIINKLERLEGGLTFIVNRSIDSLVLPELTLLRKELTILNSRTLRTVSFPQAHSDPDTVVRITANERLEQLQLPSFNELRSLEIANNEQLADMDIKALSDSGGIVIKDNPRLERIELTSLERIKHVENNIGWLRVESNESLNLLDIENVASIDGNIFVTDNPNLNSCNVMAHAARLFKNEANIQNNNDTGMVNSLTAQDQTTLDAFAGTRCAKNITIGDFFTSAPLLFSNFEVLESIESVLGDINFAGVETQAENINIPALRYVGDQVVVHGLGLTGTVGRWFVRMESLESAKNVILSSNSVVTGFSAPNLQEVKTLLVNRMRALEDLQLPSLVRINSLRVSCNPRLEAEVITDILTNLDPNNLPIQTICGNPGFPDCVQSEHDVQC